MPTVKTFLIAIAFLTLAQTAFAASTVGTTRISTGSFPEFTFQIPIGSDKTLTLCEHGADGKLECPGISRYIALIYKWLVGFTAVLAVLAITWGGVQWLISGGESGKIQEARKVIGNAVIGLLLALGSYALLYTINPKLTEFAPLTIRGIKEIELPILPVPEKVKIGAPLTTEESLESVAIESSEEKVVCVSRENFTVTKKKAANGRWGCEYSPINAITKAECAAQQAISYDKKCDEACKKMTAGLNQFVWDGKSPQIKKDGKGAEYACCSCFYQMTGGLGGSGCGLKDQNCCSVGIDIKTGKPIDICYDLKTSCQEFRIGDTYTKTCK